LKINKTLDIATLGNLKTSTCAPYHCG